MSVIGIDTPPAKLTGKELEGLCLDDAAREQKFGEWTMNRYGVQASIMGDGEGGNKTVAVASLPDFEGVLSPIGRQFIVDAKATSAASLPLKTDHLPERQIKHLIKRAEFGVITFLLIHFNRRELKTKTVEQQTWAFPVDGRMPFWKAFLAKDQRSLPLATVKEQGVPVEWRTPPRCKKSRPNLLAAIRAMETEPLAPENR